MTALAPPLAERLATGRPLIVGVLNVTPDSFSDGGRFDRVETAVAHAVQLAADGADVIDVGGESTRPGAPRIDADEQIARVVPVIEALGDQLEARLAQRGSPPAHRPLVSVDTTRAAVAAAALDAGASIVNDVSAGRDDDGLLPLVAERGCPVMLMHMRGQPATMQDDPRYDDVVAEVRRFLLDRAAAAQAAGVPADRIVTDPGIGFGKTTAHNLAILANLAELVGDGYPVMLGASRKRFIGEVTGEADAARRDAATAATTAIGVMAGVRLFRVHDVRSSRHAADVTHAAMSHQSGRT